MTIGRPPTASFGTPFGTPDALLRFASQSVGGARLGRKVKEAIIEELSTELSKRPNFFVTNINRLTAPEADVLRQRLYAAQAHLIMVSRRLGRRTIEPLHMTGLAELFEGSVALVFAGGDALPIAKIIVEFRKTHEEQLRVRGAVVDGQVLDTGAVEQLAYLPTRPVLLAQVAATLESPVADVIFTIERLLGDLAWLLEQAAVKPPIGPAAPETTQGGPAQGTPEEGTSP